MPINWSAEMDRKLFLAILKVHDISPDNKAVAEQLEKYGQPCTPMAIQKRLQKIKTMIKDEEGDGSLGGSEEGTPKVKTTPRKRGAAAAANGAPRTKKGKTVKGKGGKGKTLEAEDGDEEEMLATADLKQEDDEV